MEQPQHLIDTNSVIDYLGAKFPAKGMDFMNEVVNAIPYVSVITQIELLSFTAPADSSKLLNDFVNEAVILDLNEDVVNQTISIRKNFKTKLPDAIIAATAMVYGLTLITRNTDDFKNIKRLKLINPWEL